MDIKYKLYPHPVLISETDDYVNSTFSFTPDVKKGINELKFNFTMNLKNEELQNMLENGEVEYLIHIECPLTSYREIIVSSEKEFSKRIPEKFLNGKVAICGFIVAKHNLPNYSNCDFNQDYEGLSFSIDRGSILAIGGQSTLNIVKETENLAKVPSIFSICKYAAEEDASMNIDIDGEKIAIGLSENSFQNYKMLVNMPSLIPVFHAMIIVPTLIYVFETLRREGTEEYETKRWYVAIRKSLEKYDVILNEDTLINIPSYDLAQKILDLPIDRALSAITMIDDSEEEE